jgi:hypothetical protein
LHGDSVALQSPHGRASFSHWSFGQLARLIGAPAGYIRELPPELAARCINHGIATAPSGTVASLLVQDGNGCDASPRIRACTSETYARVWDEEIYSAILDTIVSRDPSWQAEIMSRSDRDSYLTLTNKRATLQDPSVQAIVNDPNAAAGGIMYRSLTIGNSETGARSLTIDGGLYRARCKNLMLWSFALDRSFRRRHVGKTRLVRDAIREIQTFAYAYVNRSAERDNAIIRQLIDRELAHSKDAVIDELQAIGATREQAIDAYERCERTEHVSPRSFWGTAQGLTRLSQDCPYQDGRFLLDQLASKVLARGARLVAA